MIGLESIFFANITRYYNIYGEKGFSLLITRLFGGEFDILDIKHANKKDITWKNKGMRVINWIKEIN
jgi:hypothetical protein